MKKCIVLICLFIFSCFYLYADQALDETGTVRKFGALYQNPRDIPWLVECPPPAVANIQSRQYVNHRPNMPPVGNQGSQGSCVAWALGYYYKTYQEWLERGWSVTTPRHQFSPAFLYNLVNGGVDGGSYGSDAMLALLNHGCVNMVDMQYNQSNWTNWPSESAYYNAIPYRCDSAYWMNVSDDAGITALKQHLDGGDNAVLFIYCWSNFMDIGNYHNTYCVSDVYGTNYGGHGVCIVGYDDTLTTHDGTGAFIVANSWGYFWGDQGYFWMSYEAVKDNRTSQQWACYLKDRIHYTPTDEIWFEVTHQKREWVNFTVQTSSLTLAFFDFYMPGQAAHPFPPNKIVLDITDAVAYFMPNDRNFIFFTGVDELWDNVSGTIEYTASLNNEWGVHSSSSETPKQMPDYGSAMLTLWQPTQKLHWQMFHHVPSHTGTTALTGDIDTVYAYWLYETRRPVSSPPCLGDLDNDGKIEVVIGSNDSCVYALNGENGSYRWSYQTGGAIFSAPCLGEIDQDSLLEVVVGSADGKIYALNGENGSFLWSYTTPNSIRSSPCLNDADADGLLEVIVGSDDNKVYALNGEDGSLRWSHATGAGVVSTPACADINNDGFAEVVVGSGDSRIHVLRGKTGDTLWTYAAGGSVASSPCIADIDQDTIPEVIFGSADNHLYALNGENGSVLWSYQTNGGISSSPCAGDIDSDNLPEVAVGCNDHNVYALNGGIGSLLWSHPLGDSVISSPCLGDIDGDNQPEVIVGSKNGHVYALNGGNGSVLWSYQTGGGISSSPCLGDINNDNLVEIVVGSSDNTIYALSGDPTGIAESSRSANTTNSESYLFPNYPNPCGANTVIRYLITRECRVKLVLFDVAGKKIATLVDGHKKPGQYELNLDRRSLPIERLPDGIYFICLESENGAKTQKLILIRNR